MGLNSAKFRSSVYNWSSKITLSSRCHYHSCLQVKALGIVRQIAWLCTELAIRTKYRDSWVEPIFKNNWLIISITKKWKDTGAKWSLSPNAGTVGKPWFPANSLEEVSFYQTSIFFSCPVHTGGHVPAHPGIHFILGYHTESCKHLQMYCFKSG